MTKIDRHLLVVFGLLTGTAVAVFGSDHPDPSRAVLTAPAAPAWSATGWSVQDGVPPDILPDDPRALAATRRTYTKGQETVWLVEAQYSSVNRPDSRPSVDALVPRRGVRAIDRDRLELVTTAGGAVHPVPLLRVHRPSDDINVVYWYRLGDRVVTGEYQLRWRLFLHALLRQSHTLTLIRAAASEPSTLRTFVAAAQRPGRQ